LVSGAAPSEAFDFPAWAAMDRQRHFSGSGSFIGWMMCKILYLYEIDTQVSLVMVDDIKSKF
jgi:hypothetical protein